MKNAAGRKPKRSPGGPEQSEGGRRFALIATSATMPWSAQLQIEDLEPTVERRMQRPDYDISKAEGVDYAADCERILRALPEWFGIEESIVEYVEQVANLPTWVAHVDGQVVGFVSVQIHTDRAAEIIVMGVSKPHHRCGIGKALVEAAEKELRRRGIEFFQVKTLSPRRESQAYDKTRQFYRALGFVAVQEFPTLWDEANPCLQMMKSLATEV